MSEYGCVFVTGATGFVGHYVLGALLRRRRRCVAMVRRGTEDRLWSLLDEVGASGVAGLLTVIDGELPDHLPQCFSEEVEAIVHVAGVTRFEPDGGGEPWRTNVEGTRRMLSWAEARGVAQFHLVSTAYVCGHQGEPVPECVGGRRPAFHNAYEESKWEAEQLCAIWARRGDRKLTVYRPSIVTGEWATGRATQFRGFYLSARATEMLDRSLAGADSATRRRVKLRIPGCADSPNDIVPVDFVGEAVARIVGSPRHHGGVYHLTHPNPPTNGQIKRWLETLFNLDGGTFVGSQTIADGEMGECEQLFHQMVRSTFPYMVEQPVFLRDRAEEALSTGGIRCPDVDGGYIERMVRFAQSVNWGRLRTSQRGAMPGCGTYFESFLPARVARSQVARMTALSATVRFVIEDEPQGQWTCRFDRGKLTKVHRGANGLREDFGYRTCREVFWEAVSGVVHPQELFLSGRAEIFGDVERALKMAMILHAFTREFPCDRRTLRLSGGRACATT